MASSYNIKENCSRANQKKLAKLEIEGPNRQVFTNNKQVDKTTIKKEIQMRNTAYLMWLKSG
jgi:hypothetical protein